MTFFTVYECGPLTRAATTWRYHRERNAGQSIRPVSVVGEAASVVGEVTIAGMGRTGAAGAAPGLGATAPGAEYQSRPV